MNDKTLRLVVSSSSSILDQFRWYGFRRLELRARIGRSAPQIVELARQEPPDALIVEAALPDGNGFDVCRTIKRSLGLSSVPIVVVIDGPISPDIAALMVDSACDQLLTLPIQRGQLYEALSSLLGLPSRRHGRVSIRAQVIAAQQAGEVTGELLELGATGARLRVPSALPAGAEIALRVQPQTGPALNLRSRLVWQKPHDGGSVLAVQFVDLTPEVRESLERLVTWELTGNDSGQVVRFLTDFTERLDLGGLAARLGRNVDFDMSQVQTINSLGVTRWITFQRTIPLGTSYRYTHCSTAFCAQAGYVLDFVGRGRIQSLFAPFHCAACGYEAEREFDIDAVLGGTPLLSCPSCGGELAFDGDPDRYFACARP
jgi:CheY-like chemotaxis protein